MTRSRVSRPAFLAALFMVAACGPASVAVSPVAVSSVVPAPSNAPAATAAPRPVLTVITPEAAIAAPGATTLAFDGEVMWLLGNPGNVSRIDAATNKVGKATMVSPTGWGSGGFGADAMGLWKGDFDTNLVDRIDPVTLAIVAYVPVPLNPDGVGVSDGAVWVAQHRGGSVSRIDPATNDVTTIVMGRAAPSGPHQLGFGAGSVWVSAGTTATGGGVGGAVVRIDPLTNAVQATIKIPGVASACGAFAINDQAVWMASCWDLTALVRIDPATNTVVATIDLGGYGGTPVLIDGALWITVSTSDLATEPSRLARIDPATNTIDRWVSIGDTYKGEALLLALGSVWTVDPSNSQVLRFPLAAFSR